MNYDQVAQYCYDNRPQGVLFASDDEWYEIVGRAIGSAERRVIVQAFNKLVDGNFFHKLNGKNYILNFKYFRKYATGQRNAVSFRRVHH